MIAPAHQSDSPPDLLALRTLYRDLPHPTVRWQTEPGAHFLDALFMATEKYRARHVAEVLGISTQAVYYMRELTRPRNPRRWPARKDLRALRAAWRPVQQAKTRGVSISRKSGDFTRVHHALLPLLDQGFGLQEVALAIGVPTRVLNRFLQPPMSTPDEMAQAIEKLLPPPIRRNRR